MTSRYGWGLKSTRIAEGVPDTRFERTSVISTIRLNGEQSPFMFQGTLNSEVFATYVQNVLAPDVNHGDIIILDNLSAHKISALSPIIEKGASILFLSPYSPDFNPIEKAWSKMKSIIRKLKPRTFDDLVVAMKSALDKITCEDIMGWFKSCGYVFNV